jgi:hypothetical protein
MKVVSVRLRPAVAPRRIRPRVLRLAAGTLLCAAFILFLFLGADWAVQHTLEYLNQAIRQQFVLGIATSRTCIENRKLVLPPQTGF